MIDLSRLGPETRDLFLFFADYSSLTQSEAVRKIISAYLDSLVNAPLRHHLNRACQITEVNFSWCYHLGYKPCEIVGKHITNFVDPESWEEGQRRREAYYQDKSVSDFPVTFIKSDGSFLNLLMSSHVQSLPGGGHENIATMILADR